MDDKVYELSAILAQQVGIIESIKVYSNMTCHCNKYTGTTCVGCSETKNAFKQLRDLSIKQQQIYQNILDNI